MIADSTIEAARAADLVGLISARGVELGRQGSEYKALCPFHSERTPSFTVNPAKGVFFCHGCGAKGGCIDFVMQHDRVPFPDAVKSIVGDVPAGGATPEKKRVVRAEPADEWTPITPVPADAPRPPELSRIRYHDGIWHQVAANNMWAYPDANGSLLGYIQRFDIPDYEDIKASKEIRPLIFCRNIVTGAEEWRRKAFPQPRPLYGLNKLARYPDALVLGVEGEKACDAAQARFIAAGIPMEKLVVVAWPGGANAAAKVDWSPLYGRKVGLWPDADQKRYNEAHPNAGKLIPFIEQPGTIAMLDVYKHLAEHCPKVKFFLPPSAGVPDGWDLADELPGGFCPLVHLKSRYAMNAADVKQRFSLTPSISSDGKVLPVWLVPPTDRAGLRRVEFAADVMVMCDETLLRQLDPRGVVMRQYHGLDGLRSALNEVGRLMPDARLHVLIEPDMANKATRVAHSAGASVEILSVGESWVDTFCSAVTERTGLPELAIEDWGDDELDDCEIVSGPAQGRIAGKPAGLTRDEIRRHQQQDENWRLQEIDTGAMIPSKLTVEEMLECCVWVADGGHVAFVTGDRTLFLKMNDFAALTSASKSEIEVQSGNQTKKKWVPNSGIWQSDTARRSVMKATFRPGAPVMTADPDGLLAVNTWRPINRWSATADITPFLEQVQYLFPDPIERDAFLDWLAHIEQKPGELPHYGWLHIAENTGTGRNWVASVLARVFRGYVAPNVDMTGLLNSPFNGELGGRVLAIVDEVQEGASEGNYRQAERLKSMVNAEKRLINAKYGLQRLEYNVMRWLVFSNHKNALPLNDKDRRFRVVMHKAGPRAPAEYERLYALLQEPEFINSVGVYLSERDISRFKPGERPPLNDDKMAAIAASKPMSTQAAEEIVAAWPTDIIINPHVIDLLGGNVERGGFTPAMRRAMEEAGAQQWRQGRVHKIKIDGETARVWVLRDHEKWLAESTDAVRREALRAGVNGLDKPASMVLADAVEVMVGSHESTF